jgi:hypothetical protein
VDIAIVSFPLERLVEPEIYGYFMLDESPKVPLRVVCHAIPPSAMDPISALSLASNVIAFVDFGCKVVSQTRQIYKSVNGTLSDKVFVQALTDDLVALTTNLGQFSPERDFEEHDGYLPEDSLALDDLCRRCHLIAADLLAKLERVKVKDGSAHRNWQSFKTALRATWGREEMDMLANQLSEIRSEIEFRVLVNFRLLCFFQLGIGHTKIC